MARGRGVEHFSPADGEERREGPDDEPVAIEGRRRRFERELGQGRLAAAIELRDRVLADEPKLDVAVMALEVTGK